MSPSSSIFSLKRARLKLAVFDHNLFSMDGEICDCIINLDPILRQAKLEAMPVERKKTAFKLSSTGERAGEPRGEVQVRTSTHRGDKETTGIGE